MDREGFSFLLQHQLLYVHIGLVLVERLLVASFAAEPGAVGHKRVEVRLQLVADLRSSSDVFIAVGHVTMA